MNKKDEAWESIFDHYQIHKHDFNNSPFYITAQQIKEATKKFKDTGHREVRILCKQDTREERPEVFIKNNLFILPVKNGHFVILKGEGYVDIPKITTKPIIYEPKISFELRTSKIGNSEMQHLDYAYAVSIIRHFTQDPTLILTIRGRKYTPQFDFRVNKFKLTAKSVQTEIDAGYEGDSQIVLIEAKNTQASNVIIRQLYFPFRQWQIHIPDKPIKTIFFEKVNNNEYHLWLFQFTDPENYNSIQLIQSASYLIK